MQMKSTQRIHLPLVRISIIKKTNENKYWWGYPHWGALILPCQKCKMVHSLFTIVWKFLFLASAATSGYALTFEDLKTGISDTDIIQCFSFQAWINSHNMSLLVASIYLKIHDMIFKLFLLNSIPQCIYNLKIIILNNKF